MERWLKQLSCRTLLSIPFLAPLMPLNWAEVIISHCSRHNIICTCKDRVVVQFGKDLSLRSRWQLLVSCHSERQTVWKTLSGLSVGEFVPLWNG